MFNRWVVILVICASAFMWSILYLLGASIETSVLSLSAAIWATLLVGFAVVGLAGIMLLAAWITVRSL
jgi:hypothetical protein